MVTGFYDTLPLFKVLYQNQSSYSQTHLFEAFLHDTYSVHDSLQDVTALKKLVHQVRPSNDDKSAASFSTDSSLIIKTRWNFWRLFEAFDRPKGISAGMGTTGSGLSPNHLHLAYQRYGREGVHEVLSEMSGDCIRVTKSKSIFDSIADFFRSEQ